MAKRTVYELENASVFTDEDIIEVAQIDGIERKATLSQLRPVVAPPLEEWQMGVPEVFKTTPRVVKVFTTGGDHLIPFSEWSITPLHIIVAASGSGINVFFEEPPQVGYFYVSAVITLDVGFSGGFIALSVFFKNLLGDLFFCLAGLQSDTNTAGGVKTISTTSGWFFFSQTFVGKA